MNDIEINIAIAKSLGYRKWQFGDAWPKGLKLADNRFDGYIRRVLVAAASDAYRVKLDLDEDQNVKVTEIFNNYEPKSHCVSPAGKITLNVPNYCHDLNAIAEVERTKLFTDPELWLEYITLLQNRTDYQFGGACAWVSATARQRAESYLKTIGKWVE